MFQNGDVDYLVATDAVGMGLNLDVDHVAFASDRKYDGYQFRRLNPSEFAQIAGRAGRATRDGTFGTTGRCAPFEPELVNALQNHTFESVKVLQWRNSKLDFSSLGALAGVAGAVASHEVADPRADRRGSARARSRRARRRCAGHGAWRRRRGTAVGRLPDSGLPQDRARRACRAGHDPVRIPDAKGAGYRTPGSPPRSIRPTGSTAISTRYRAGSRKSAPGPLSPTVRTGWPIPSIGRESHAMLKINCPMRCMNGSRSVSLIAVPVY